VDSQFSTASSLRWRIRFSRARHALANEKPVIDAHMADDRLVELSARDFSEVLQMTPLKLMTAISLVPPPISTMMLPSALKCQAPRRWRPRQALQLKTLCARRAQSGADDRARFHSVIPLARR
jgi:hypothetical protein